MADESELALASSDSANSMVARTESSWREWSQRENGEDGYKFGDFSRGLLHQMKAGVRDLKHKAADAALTLKETHEQRAVDYVRELAAGDEDLQDVAQNAMEAKASTSAERLWTQICKDAHTDHEDHMDEILSEEATGMLEVEVVKLGTYNFPLLRPDRKVAEKAVLLLSLMESRSKSLKEGTRAKFQVTELLGTDLVLYTFDRASPKFAMGMEDKACCGGSVLPLSAILQPDQQSFSSALYSSFSQERFEVQLQLQLLPLQLLRGRRKLQIGEVSGINTPQETFGHIVLKLKLTLKQSPAKLFLSPLSPGVPRETLESKGHVSDPFSVIKACGLSVARLTTALRMEALKAALHEMRENWLVMIWWSTLMLMAPLWTWPFIFNIFLATFAWTLNRCQRRCCARLLYADEGEEKKEEADVVKEAVKASLHIMQFTENLNKAAAQIEKLTFALGLEDRCLSSIFLMFCFTCAVPMSLLTIILPWIFTTGLWRYLLWFPGTFIALPEAVREVLHQGLQHLEEMAQEMCGDDFERRLQGFWQRVPDDTEASHLHLFKRYVFRGKPVHESL